MGIASAGKGKNMSPIRKIDEIDALILRDLLLDGRKGFTEIAGESNVSKDVIWNHYSKMNREGIIVGATIQLDYAALGYDISTSFFFDTPVRHQQQVIEQLRKIPGIYDAYRMGSHSRIWAVSDLMKAEQIEQVKQLIKKLPSVLRLEVEIWTGVRNIPENLSILNGDTNANKTEADISAEDRIEEEGNRIDEIDRQLIEKLTANSRASFNSIGKELGISSSTTMRRYNNLKRKRIIRPLIQINPEKIGYPIEAFFRLGIESQGDINDIAVKIAKIPDVHGVVKTTAPHDLSIFTAIKNLDHLTELETRIANIYGVREMEAPALNQLSILPYPREHISTF